MQTHLAPCRARHSLRSVAASTLLACVLAVGGGSARADGQSAPATDTTGPTLLSPTLGRPVFVEPGGTMQVVARIPDASEPVSIELVRPGPHGPGYRLKCDPDAAAKLQTGQPLAVRVPPTVACQTYDLSVVCSAARLAARHCVAVGHVGRSLRLVHLGNMNIGDISAPHFDPALVDEINLVAPTLIVATGDYLDATHPDPRAGWQELVDFLTSLDAPTVLACGDHDDMGAYSRQVAPSPIGVVNVGPNRCLVAFDHTLAPIRADAEQIRWIEHILTQPGFDGMTFVLSHDEYPSLLHYWRQQGTLSRLVSTGRIGLWFSGGHCDWDGREFSELIDAASPMLYVRTQESSTAPREGASGQSHYRIVDIVDNRVLLPQATPMPAGISPSTPVGYLHAAVDGSNDGSASRLSFSATNNLPYRLDGLALTLWLQKLDGFTPWCHGARLEQATDLGSVWECRVRFDLPDKGGLRAVAGSEAEPPLPSLNVSFDLPQTLHFRPQTSTQGVAFLALAGQSPLVHVQNTGQHTVRVTPTARLDGNPLAYRPAVADARLASAYELALDPGQSVSLQLDLSAIRVQPGRRAVQMYCPDGGVAVPFCQAVEIVVGGEERAAVP